NRVFRIARLDDLPDRAADHRVPDGSRCRIRFCGVHATTHVWVERKIDDTHEHLALAGVWRRPFRQLKIVEAGWAFRSALQQDLAVDACSHRFSPSARDTLLAENRSHPQYLGMIRIANGSSLCCQRTWKTSPKSQSTARASVTRSAIVIGCRGGQSSSGEESRSTHV